MPAQPEALPYVPSNPALQPKDRADPRPAGNIPTSRRYTTATRRLIPDSSRCGNCAKSLAPSAGTARHFAAPLPAASAVDAKPQELPLPRPPRPALRLVHFQSQTLLDPVPDPRQHPLRRRFTANINVAVLGIAAKAQPHATAARATFTWLGFLRPVLLGPVDKPLPSCSSARFNGRPVSLSSRPPKQRRASPQISLVPTATVLVSVTHGPSPCS